MPLALDDPRWSELEGSYIGTEDILTWLAEAYQTGMTEEQLGDLINEVQHQGDTTSAMYAVAPHLVALAKTAEPSMKLALLTHTGLIHAESRSPHAVPCPEFLAPEFAAIAAESAPELAAMLPSARDSADFKYAVAALAGFVGHQAFRRLLCGLK